MALIGRFAAVELQRVETVTCGSREDVGGTGVDEDPDAADRGRGVEIP